MRPRCAQRVREVECVLKGLSCTSRSPCSGCRLCLAPCHRGARGSPAVQGTWQRPHYGCNWEGIRCVGFLARFIAIAASGIATSWDRPHPASCPLCHVPVLSQSPERHLLPPTPHRVTRCKHKPARTPTCREQVGLCHTWRCRRLGRPLRDPAVPPGAPAAPRPPGALVTMMGRTSCPGWVYGKLRW